MQTRSPGLSSSLFLGCGDKHQPKPTGAGVGWGGVASMRLACRHVGGACSRLLIDVGGPSLVWALPPVGRWAWTV